MTRGGRRNADEAVLTALAAGATIRQASEQTGVSERTIYRRLADVGFRQRVTSIRAGMLERAVGKVADGMADAAGTLRSLLVAEGESVRLGAARALLELGVKLRESVELEQRLQTLEQRLVGKL
jgi:hypothetical protein